MNRNKLTIEEEVERLKRITEALCLGQLGWSGDEDHKIYQSARATFLDVAVGVREKLKRQGRVSKAKKVMAEELSGVPDLNDKFREIIGTALINFAGDANWKKPEDAAQEIIDELFSDF